MNFAIFFHALTSLNSALLSVLAGRAEIRIPMNIAGLPCEGAGSIPGAVSLAAGPTGPSRAMNTVSGPFRIIVRGALPAFAFLRKAGA